MNELNYEQIVSEIKADLIAADPDLAPALELESEPLVKLIQILAYRLLAVQNQINHSSQSRQL